MDDYYENELLDLIKCPECGHLDTMDGFDGLGACGGNVFCPCCHTEFDPDTNLKHDHRSKCCQGKLLRSD